MTADKEEKIFSGKALRILGVATVGTFMAALDASIVNVSIPALLRSFQASVHEVEWVITAYMISFAVFIPITSWLKERMGAKNLYLMSLSIFVFGSLLCGLAWSLPVLILARVIQAIGGGSLTPTAMVLVSDAFEPKHRGIALGYWGIGGIMGPTLGPTLGGFLTEHWGWRSIFLVNLPVGLLAIYLSYKILRKPTQREIHRAHFDGLGFCLLAISLVSFLYGIAQVGNLGWGSVSFLGLIAIALLMAALFVFREIKATAPMIDFSIFRSKTFFVCMGITACRSAALFGGVFLLPLFMQEQMHMSETNCGLVLLPGSVIMAMLMPFSGKWSDTRGPRWITVAGLLLVTLSMVFFSLIEANSSVPYLVFVTIIRGLGIGLLATPISVAAINAVAKHQVITATSLQSLIQQVAGSIGIASMAAIYQYRSLYYLKQFGSDVTGKAQVLATQDAFLGGAVLTLLSIFLAWNLPRVAGPSHSGSVMVPE